MYILVGIIILATLIVILSGLYSVYKTKINFFITGFDSKFSLNNLILLWKVAEYCKLENPTSLFFSLQSLQKCMTEITSQMEMKGTNSDPKMQLLLTKLFEYRTKLQHESDEKKGMDSTRGLERGQKLRIILPGKGVFVSEVLNSGKELIISVPRQNDLIPITAEEWVGKVINVYLWKKGDARYVFDTTVEKNGMFIGESSLLLKHSTNLIRTQKRKSVRAKCNINAQLYIIKTNKIDYNAVETQNGYKCVLEDISESGALIHIGGKGAANVQLKLQFKIQNELIIMFGIVRTAEYNQEKNESRLHFECIHIDLNMKNEVLKYVYNMLPQNEKEVFDALKMTEADAKADEEIIESIEQNINKNNENSVTNSNQDNLNNIDTKEQNIQNENKENLMAEENKSALNAETNKDPIQDDMDKLKKLITADALLPADDNPPDTINVFENYGK